jgi:hypothetical protein
MKDPRISRLLAFWQDVFNQLNAQVSYVIACRNPLSVAQSLNKRDGFDLEKGYLLWIEHTLRSLTGTVGMTRLVVDYDRLMDDPITELQNISRFLNVKFDANTPSVIDFKHNFLESSLCHNRYLKRDLQESILAPDDAKDLYEILFKLSENSISLDSPQPIEKIQEIKARLQKNYSLLRYLRYCDDQRIEMTSKSNQAFATLAERDAQLAERDAQLAERAAQLESLLTSRSWRVTAPLRALGQTARSIRGRGQEVSRLVRLHGVGECVRKARSIIKHRR